MTRTIEGTFSAAGCQFAICVSRFNHFITEHLANGARDALRRHGVTDDAVVTFVAPGAWELPLLAKRIADLARFDAIICLGAVIRGSTPHFDYVAAEVSKGLSSVSLAANVPVSFGVLTTDTIEQAIERAGTKAGNKGWDAAMAAIETVSLLRQVSSLTD